MNTKQVTQGAGGKFKEMHRQGDEKEETIQHLLSAGTTTDAGEQTPGQSITHTTNIICGAMSHVIIKPASETSRFSPEKPHSKWSGRRDALVCTLAVIALGLLILVIVVAVFVLRGNIQEQKLVTDDSVKVLISCGPVSGLSIDGAYAFFGIPYAVNPTENLRFRKTVPLTQMEDCWQGTYVAHEKKPLCFQNKSRGLEDEDMSEDCLYLDVCTPEISYKKPLPVVVYFRGETSLGHDEFSIRLQPSAKLARDEKVVFVSVSYRVHAFGFMALRMLRQGHPSSSGNYGLHDMLAALRWVQMNIDSFGGNSRSVTVLGHGFSATAILALVMSPSAGGLFNKAWISGGATEIVNGSLTHAEEANTQFLKNLRCKSARCLELKFPEAVVEAAPWYDVLDLPFNNELESPRIVADGQIVRHSILKSLRRSEFNDVSLIIGATSYSVGNWSHLDAINWTEVVERVQIRLRTISEHLSHDAVANYLLKSEPVSLQYSKMISDVRIRCPLFQLARSAHNKFLNDVFVYSSSYRQTSQIRFDIAAIFGQVEQFLGHHMTVEDHAYQRVMSNLFYSYIKTNKLGSVGGINPPGYIDVTNHVKVHAKDPKCDLWLKSNIYPQYARHD